jgi:hypothetical protein
MEWLTASALGACGGVLVQVIDLWTDLDAWHKSRREAIRRGDPSLPKLTAFIDPQADILVAVTRLILGALAGLIFHTQVTGAVAAIAVGAAAPALLRQFGTQRAAETPQVSSMLPVPTPAISRVEDPPGTAGMSDE